MPDYVINKLTIRCESSDVMQKIKRVIFRYEDNYPNFTMKKLLPCPEEFAQNPDYTEIGFYLCVATWGTKWDARYPRVYESGSTYVITYDTAWDPNHVWVQALCRFIGLASFSLNKKKEKGISVSHFFCDEYEEIGTEGYWDPITNDWTYKENVSASFEFLGYKSYEKEVVKNNSINNNQNAE